MAKTSDSTWPVAKYHFRVEFLGEQYSFQEVTGLNTEITPIDYRVGSSVPSMMKLNGLHKASNVILKKGIFKDDKDLNKILIGIAKGQERYYDEKKRSSQLMKIFLLDEKGEIIMGWEIKRPLPIKLSGTDLKSTENAIAIETIEFACDEIKILD